eukprot:TRINITY_DN478_c0_g1_i1.p1 TRINITY_DN478_c0_g1~~TRINITY_DN478_c0_g1_i1.p1  ORF type:complete len:270 (-),score=103.43 TRINITY_DN478_c0_g1_i1:101-910(-)
MSAPTKESREIPRVSSTDVEGMRALARKHEETGMPFIIRDEHLAERAKDMKMPDLAGLLGLFGSVGEGYGTNFAFKRASVLREDVHKVICEKAQLCKVETHQGERYRISHKLKGKEFHAGPGYNFKCLLMVSGTKRWEIIDPKYTEQLSPSEEGMCGMRICVADGDELEMKLSKEAIALVPIISGVQETGDILVLNSQWWHSTKNLTEETAMVVNKYSNPRIYNETIHQRELVCKINVEDGTRNCKKSKHNELGALKWSCGFFSAEQEA